MAALGDLAAAEVTASHVEALLSTHAREDVGREASTGTAGVLCWAHAGVPVRRARARDGRAHDRDDDGRR